MSLSFEPVPALLGIVGYIVYRLFCVRVRPSAAAGRAPRAQELPAGAGDVPAPTRARGRGAGAAATPEEELSEDAALEAKIQALEAKINATMNQPQPTREAPQEPKSPQDAALEAKISSLEAKINATMEEPIAVQEPMDEPEPEACNSEPESPTVCETSPPQAAPVAPVRRQVAVQVIDNKFGTRVAASWVPVVFCLILCFHLGNIRINVSPSRVVAYTESVNEVSDVEVETQAQAATTIAAQQEAQAAPAPPMNKNLVVMNLTRQEMAVQQQGDQMHYKSAYWGYIRAGTPAQTFKVVFDTGSGHLILPSGYCNSETCRAHSRFRRSKSTSAKDIDHDGSLVEAGQPRDQITVEFGTGEVDGVFVEDVVCLNKEALGLNGSSGDGDNCMKMRVIAATKMSQEPFMDFHFDGVLGLGLSALSQAPEFNFARTLANSMGGSPEEGERPNMFSVFLAEDKDETSQITFGGYSEEKVDGALSWSPVIDPEHGHWMVRIKALRVNGELVSFCEDDTCKAAVDTGTSLLAVPTPLFPELYSLLRHPVGASGECAGAGPQLRFELDTPDHFEVVLGPEDYSQNEANLPNAKQPTPKSPILGEATEQPVVHCKPMLMSMDLAAPIGPKLFILGEPALRKYMTVYDGEEKRIGFGFAKHK